MPSLPSQLRANLLLLGAASQLAVGCAETESEEIEIAAPTCNTLSLGEVPADASFVLIVNDTMRRDSAGIYGGAARTPHFDALARDGLLFSRAVAPGLRAKADNIFSFRSALLGIYYLSSSQFKSECVAISERFRLFL